MKFTRTENAAPEIAGVSPVPAALSLAAGFLLSWLPLLFTRGTQAWFSDAPSVWIHTLGFVIATAGLGIMAGGFASRRMAAGSLRWLLTALLLAAFASLPLLPAREAMGVAPANAAMELLKLLFVKVGPVAFVLGLFIGTQLSVAANTNSGMATTIGLLVGQIAFLVVLDPLLPTSRLDVAFSWSVLAFALVAIVSVWRFPTSPASQPVKAARAGARPQWVGVVETSLLGVMVALLIVVTARSMSDSVSTPKLWVLPCLITVVAYSAGRLRASLQRPVVVGVLQCLSALALTAVLFLGAAWPFAVLLQVLYVGLATGVMALAAAGARLAAQYPDGPGRRPSLLGVLIALILVTFVAQRFASDTTEYPLTILVGATLVVMALMKTGGRKLTKLLGVAGLVVLLAALGYDFHLRNLNAVGRVRTFFGVTTAVNVGAGADEYLLMRSGNSPRAAQFRAAEVRFEPTLFHGRNTGIGLLFRSLPKGNFRRVGIIGIGNGDLVAYAHPTDVFRFYEFDPGTARMADGQFGYLPHADFNWELIPGDPRRVLAQAEPERFDVLILDVFSGGALPAHLLTAEAFAVWRKHLGPDGVLAVNVTNARFDLVPVVWRQALELGLTLAPAFTSENAAAGIAAAEWVFLTGNKELIRKAGFQVPGEKANAEARQLPLWTDESYEPLSRLK